MIATLTSSSLVAFVGFHLLLGFLLMAGMVLYFKPQLWFGLLAALFGLLACFVDLLSHELQLPMFLILAGCFFVAFARPVRPWRWALLIGLWIPAVGLLARAAGIIPTASSTEMSAPLLALLPALAGAYAGCFVACASSPRRLPETFNLKKK